MRKVFHCLNPDEENLLEARVSKTLPLESLAKSEFLETVSKLLSMWAFLNLQFRFHNMLKVDFDPSQQVDLPGQSCTIIPLVALQINV